MRSLSTELCRNGHKREKPGRCMACQAECNRRWRLNNRAKVNGHVKVYGQRLRDIVTEAYGGKCACPRCPESNSRFLTLDHVNNDGVTDRRGRGRSRSLNSYRRAIREGFPSEFQLLCWNCNSGRAANGGVCPHMEEGS